MSRIRTIKPELFTHEDLAELPIFARMLFIGLLTLADRRGRLEDRPKRIKAAIFPYDEVDVDQLIDHLVAGKFIIRYHVHDLKLVHIVNFEKHQRCNIREPESLLPPPQDSYQDTALHVQDTALHVHARASTCTHVRARVEGEGEREGNKDKTPPPTTAREREPSLAEVSFERCFDAEQEKIRKLFPLLDFELVKAKCLAKYRGKPPRADPLVTILKFCEFEEADRKAALRRNQQPRGGVGNAGPNNKNARSQTSGLIEPGEPDADWLGDWHSAAAQAGH